MDTGISADSLLVARLKRLEAGEATVPTFGYDAMMVRHEHRQLRARRRLHAARAVASVLVVAVVGASVWRIDHGRPAVEEPVAQLTSATGASAPRIVRADTYFALAAIEDHLASVDDALSVARAYSPRGAEVARLERTRAELLDSYSRVRYAEMVNATY